jgi:hypothetical protein
MANGTKLIETTSLSGKAVPAHHLLLITAAVAATCGECARILGIAPVEPVFLNQWGRSGRLAIQSSHGMLHRDGIVQMSTKQDPGAPKR